MSAFDLLVDDHGTTVEFKPVSSAAKAAIKASPMIEPWQLKPDGTVLVSFLEAMDLARELSDQGLTFDADLFDQPGSVFGYTS